MNNDPGLMLAALSNKRNGFFLIETEGYDARADLVQKLKLGLGKMVSEIERVDFSKNKNELDFFEFLLQSIHNREIPPEIILLENIEEDPGFQDDPDNYLFRINLFREPLEQLGANIVFVTSLKFADQLLRKARDLADWITQRFVFESNNRINPGQFMQSLSYCYPELGMDKRDKEYDKKMLDMLLEQEKDARETGKDESYIARVILPDIAVYYLYSQNYSLVIDTCKRILELVDKKKYSNIFFGALLLLGDSYIELALIEKENNKNLWFVQLDSAKYFYDEALSLFPEEKEILKRKARLFSFLEQYDKAISALQQIDGPEIDVFVKLGALYYELGDYEKARYYTEKAYTMDESDFDANFLFGAIYAKTNNYQKSLEYMFAAEKIEPDNPELLCNIAAVFGSLGDYYKAIGYGKKSLEFKPEQSNANKVVGDAYGLIGDSSASIKYLEQVLKFEPNNYSTLNNIACAYTNIDNNKKAIEYYEQALQIDKNDGLAQFNLSLVYAKTGELQKSIDYLQEAVNLNPTFRERAKTDSDFDSLRDDPEFRRIVFGE